jgi:hypothetical protein
MQIGGRIHNTAFSLQLTIGPNKLESYNSNIRIMLIGILFKIWLLNQWRYNQVQKLVLHRYVLNFSLGLCGLILFGDF